MAFPEDSAHHRGTGKLLTAQEERQLIERAHAGSDKAKELLFKSNTRLVHKVAQKFKCRAGLLEYDDLFQEGCLGLLRAIEKFDVAHATRFSTYACCWVEQAIRRAIDEKARMIRLPAGKLTKIKQQWAAGAEDPAEASGVPSATYTHPLSLDAMMEGIEAPLGDFLGDDGFEEEFINSSEQDAFLRELLAKLPERQRRVIEKRYGIPDGRTQSLAEIGATMGLTREGVRHIEVKALAELRRLAEGREESAAGLKIRAPKARILKKKPLNDFLKKAGFEENLANSMSVDEFRQCFLSRLTERQRTIIEHRLGLAGEVPKTQKTIGKLFGIGQGTVNKCEIRALAALRRLVQEIERKSAPSDRT